MEDGGPRPRLRLHPPSSILYPRGHPTFNARATGAVPRPSSGALAQPRPYIGYVYPAGGQQGTTFQIRLGGQGWDDVSEVLVTGSGVTARITDNYRRLDFTGNAVAQRASRAPAAHDPLRSSRTELVQMDKAAMLSDLRHEQHDATPTKPLRPSRKRRLPSRCSRGSRSARASTCLRPASAAIASLVLVEVTIAPDAEPGEREIRLVTPRGMSNPLVFYVGQVPEVSDPPMLTAIKQVLGKESSALRKRPAGEDEHQITLPCTVNGQIASGEVNRYHFEARKGQHLVITVLGRHLVPFMADAVPGWFQPVLALYDADGKEVAYDDDYRFKPDPTIFYEVPTDGEYVFAIHDSIYRGREDFVYRITIGELPFITSIFPLGGPVDPAAHAEGQGLESRRHRPDARRGRRRARSPIPHRRQEGIRVQPRAVRPGHAAGSPRKGTQQHPGHGAEGDAARHHQRAHRQARRLGRVPVHRQVQRDRGRGSHCAPARFSAGFRAQAHRRRPASCWPSTTIPKTSRRASTRTTPIPTSWSSLPADGTYYVHIGDTARQGGEEYGYRLRLSAPQPDFELRVVPSSLSIRSNSSAQLTVYAMRKDGFKGPIKLSLKNPPEGFSSAPATLRRHPDRGTGEHQDPAALEPRSPSSCPSLAPQRSVSRKSRTWPCRRRTACRPSSGGSSSRQKTCSAWSSTRATSLRRSTLCRLVQCVSG